MTSTASGAIAATSRMTGRPATRTWLVSRSRMPELDRDPVGRKRRDLGEFAGTGEHDAPRAGRFTAREFFAIFLARGAEEFQRNVEILRDQPALLGKTLWREVIRIAPRRGLLDLDQALVHGPVDQRVHEADGYPDLARELALVDRLLAGDIAQQLDALREIAVPRRHLRLPLPAMAHTREICLLFGKSREETDRPP